MKKGNVNMKFTFYYEGKKKKKQVIKTESKKDLLIIAKVAKCELTKYSILKDLDFSINNGRLMCEVKDKKYTMQELWKFLDNKLQVTENIKKKKDNNKLDKKKKNKKDKKKNKDKKMNKPKISNDGLIHITRINKNNIQ